MSIHGKGPWVRSKYKHMLRGEEQNIWSRWLEEYGDPFDSFQYDVHLGKGGEVLPGTDGSLAADWKRLTQKRADVVAWSKGEPTIIEIKEYASLGTRD